MNKSKIISAMLMTTLLFGVFLLRADDKQKQQPSAKQAQQQQVKKDVAQHNAKYSQPLPAGSPQAAQAQQEQRALQQRQQALQQQQRKDKAKQ